MDRKKLLGAISKVVKKATTPNTNEAWRAQSAIRTTGRKIKDKINKSDQTWFRNAGQRDEAYMEKVIKDKKHVAGRSKQVTRIIDRKKRTASEAPVTKKKGSALKTIAKVTGTTLAAGAALTTGAEYAKKKNAEAKANANKVKVNANKVSQNASKVNANTFKNYKNEEKVAENTRKVVTNKAKVQDNAVKVYSNAEKVNAEKARTATTNAQKVAANKAKIEANKKKVAANKAKYK